MSTSPYRWLRRLGTGSSGVVWAVERDGRQFAVKVLKPHGTKAHAEAIRRECRIGPIIAEHPGVVGVRRVEELDGVLHLEMDRVDGPSLAQVITGRAEAKRGPIPASIAVPWTVAVLQALLWVSHKVAPQAPGSFCHRDIKPANLLLEPTGRVRITDFGIARAEVERGFLTTQTGVLKGSPRFMAPEVILERVPDARSDQFSLGVVLFELLTGHALYVGRDISEVLMLAVGADVEKRLPLVKGPTPLIAVLRRMLARDPAQRYPNHGAAMAALAGIAVPGPKVEDLIPEFMTYIPETDDVPLEDLSGETTNPVVSMLDDETDPNLVPRSLSTLTFLGPRGTLPESLHKLAALPTLTPDNDVPTMPGFDPYPLRVDELDSFGEPDLTTDSGEDDLAEHTPVVAIHPPGMTPGAWGAPNDAFNEDGPTQVGRSPLLEEALRASGARASAPLALLPSPTVRKSASEADTEVLASAQIEAMLAEAQALPPTPRGATPPPVPRATPAPAKAATPKPARRVRTENDPPSGLISRRYEPWLVVISILVVLVAAGGAFVIAVAATWLNSR